ncbi:MAG TPA: phosphoribosylformylglycinamidine synthase, partial [Desulfocapsa sulfexigens]|nr:phosphoribosylformylglycinamidine synthase [Desulfocapsa sulfexigens]
MSLIVSQLYRKVDRNREYCFNIESSQALSSEELKRLRLILADGFLEDSVTDKPLLTGDRVVEMGPRLNFATAWSSNMVSICNAIGLGSISRVERSRRYLVAAGQDLKTFVQENHDRMTECLYPEALSTFETGIEPEAVYDVDMKSGGPDALLDIPGISMDERDRNFYYDYFVKKHDRNPTIVEIMDLNNANSEHSRHGFFGGYQVIDGKKQKETLFQLVKETLSRNPKGSLVAFKDNSSVVEGHDIHTIIPQTPGLPCALKESDARYHMLLTAETHNFPTGVAPFPGAETGAGGRIRDVQATGKGGFVIAGTTGYCVANLHIPGYTLPWENSYQCPESLASALDIEIEASNGASDYG